ncbi:MAG TPA: MFS transporter [Polyangia bacterium]|nr:MFS transporter [Polyangia bacterium]
MTVPPPSAPTEGSRPWRWHLALATVSFFVCFAAWGLISGLASQLRSLFHLGAAQVALLIAEPVLLGALARLPLGIAADRFGGRRVFAVLMLAVAVPIWLLPTASTFHVLLGFAFVLGLAGASFAVGVSYVARWAPTARQGGALGIYGLGTLGQSAAVILGPTVGARLGWASVFRGTALVLVAWGIVFALLARDAPKRAAPAGAPATSLGAVLRHERKAWALSFFYFLTFGGFVAFSVYLPTLLRDTFHLSPANAGLRAAGFVALATLCRPLGGILADNIGGARVLRTVFLGIIPFTLLMTWEAMIPFTVGALGCATLMGFGNGAVFKLVPQHFPHNTGTVTGLVGAMGGLGGFFPPLVLGVLRERMGIVWPGFLLLAAFALVLALVNDRMFLAGQLAEESLIPHVGRRRLDQLRAGATATFAAALLVAAIVVGSRNLTNFDAALVVYTFAVVFAFWGALYHYAVWIQKPPTRRLWRRSWRLFREQSPFALLARAAGVVITHLLAQTFIRRRSRLRWWTHQFIFTGCVLAAAVTFPLVFGWVHFRTDPLDQRNYVAFIFGFEAGSFRLGTPVAWLTFHALDVAAVLVLAGIALALARRLRDRGALAQQAFDRDFLPLILLFAVSVTGLALTISTQWLRGSLYSFLAMVHAITVIGTLLYLPFGKFFHIVQRPAQVGVKLYQAAGARGAAAVCARCREPYASQMQIDDLRGVLGELGFDYSVPGPAGHWQGLCPPCKRKSIASAQLRLRGQAP